VERTVIIQVRASGHVTVFMAECADSCIFGTGFLPLVDSIVILDIDAVFVEVYSSHFRPEKVRPAFSCPCPDDNDIHCAVVAMRKKIKGRIFIPYFIHSILDDPSPGGVFLIPGCGFGKRHPVRIGVSRRPKLIVGSCLIEICHADGIRITAENPVMKISGWICAGGPLIRRGGLRLKFHTDDEDFFGSGQNLSG